MSSQWEAWDREEQREPRLRHQEELIRHKREVQERKEREKREAEKNKDELSGPVKGMKKVLFDENWKAGN